MSSSRYEDAIVSDEAIEELHMLFMQLPIVSGQTSAEDPRIQDFNEKAQRIKQVIIGVLSSTGRVMVKREELINWRTRQHDDARFREEVKTDVTYIVRTLKGLKDKFTTKTAISLVMGKLNPEKLGVDINRVMEIGKRYVPEEFESIEKQNNG